MKLLRDAHKRPLPAAIRYLFLVRLINAAGSFVMPFMTMLLTAKLGWTSERSGLFMTGMALAGGAAMLAAGKLGDAIGRKRLIVSCQAAAALLFLTGFAAGIGPALPWIAAAANVLLSSTWPVFNAMVADLAGPEERKRAYSLIYWGNNIGFSLGPIAAGFLFNRATSLMFLANALALAAVSCILGFRVRETIPPRRGNAQETARAEAPERGGIAAVLARRPFLLGFALALALLNFVYAQHQFSLPIYLVDRLGDGGAAAYGAAMTANALTVVACTLPLGLLSARLSPLACMPIAGLLYACGFGLISFLGAGGLAVLFLSTFVWSLGEILAATNVNAYIASRSPASHRSRLNSLVSLIAQSGSMICPLASGSYVRSRGIAAVWPAAALLGCLGAASMLALLVAERTRGANPATTENRN